MQPHFGCTDVELATAAPQVEAVKFAFGKDLMRARSCLIFVVMLMATATTLHAQAGLPSYRLQEERDSFEIRIQGKPMGFSVLGVTPDGDGFRVTEHTRMGDALIQQTEILLDKQQRLQAVQQKGRMRGHDTRIAIRYADQRVRGDAIVLRREGGTDTLHIDMLLPANAVDDNLLLSLLSVLPWTQDASWTIPVFSAGQNRLTDWKLSVAGIETVIAASGQLDAYRVQLQGAENEVTYWLRLNPPHRVLKISTHNGALELVRVN